MLDEALSFEELPPNKESEVEPLENKPLSPLGLYSSLSVCLKLCNVGLTHDLSDIKMQTYRFTRFWINERLYSNFFADLLAWILRISSTLDRTRATAERNEGFSTSSATSFRYYESYFTLINDQIKYDLNNVMIKTGLGFWTYRTQYLEVSLAALRFVLIRPMVALCGAFAEMNHFCSFLLCDYAWTFLF